MRDYDLSYHFDESLHEIPNNATDMDLYVHEMKTALTTVQDPIERVKTLGQIGVYLRIMRELEEAQDYFLKALEIIERHSLDPVLRIQQQMRLAHVHQWLGDFEVSNKIFEDLLKESEQKDFGPLQSFLWQHMGKNYFDQLRWREAHDCFEKALSLRIASKAPEDQISSSRESAKAALQRMN
ncbi:tetratricopeptide repeat protein [Bdellovibrio sp. HCB337]|uniref:tetratricopeptide repeat protein n=1 Tax=Bdellovibrio sp. HCB337 TaxID=3394358 RepID=UPI0039A44EBD